jgi:hypothetical protein
MNVDLAQELLNELGSSLENLETQQAALLQFLKDEGIVTDDQLVRYLDQASKASNVRWRAARVRLERLFSTEKEKEEQLAKIVRQAGAVQTTTFQDQGKDAKDRNAGGSAESAPQSEAAVANAATDAAGVQSASEKDREQNEGVTREDQNTGPKQEKNAA